MLEARVENYIYNISKELNTEVIFALASQLKACISAFLSTPSSPRRILYIKIYLLFRTLLSFFYSSLPYAFFSKSVEKKRRKAPLEGKFDFRRLLTSFYALCVHPSLIVLVVERKCVTLSVMRVCVPSERKYAIDSFSIDKLSSLSLDEYVFLFVVGWHCCAQIAQ